jgi:hypothetical protein
MCFATCSPRCLQRCSRNVEPVNIFQQLHSDFQSTAANRTSRTTLQRLATTTPALVGYNDFASVVVHLKRDTSTDTAILNALLQHAPTVPIARRTTLKAFIPVIVNREARRSTNKSQAARCPSTDATSQFPKWPSSWASASPPSTNT